MAKKAKKSTDSKETTSAAKTKKSNKPATEDLSTDSIDIDVYDEQPSGPTISIRTAKD